MSLTESMMRMTEEEEKVLVMGVRVMRGAYFMAGTYHDESTLQHFQPCRAKPV